MPNPADFRDCFTRIAQHHWTAHFAMAFNLQKVLRALLFSSNQPLSVKDVQTIFARFHDQAPAVVTVVEGEASEAVEQGETPEQTESSETTELSDNESDTSNDAEAAENQPVAGESVEVPEAEEVSVVAPEDMDAELYTDVPSLITAAQIREAFATIGDELKAANDIYILSEGPSGYRLLTHPRFARWIRIMRDEPPPVKLTQSALETLAIVAYRQPVTRTDIETIRGVSAEAGLNKLLERELVYITGRADLPGRPLQYGTTDKFLEFVGVKSLVELPASDVLSPRQIDEWLRNAATTKPPADAEMGLPLEEGEGESPNLDPVSVEQSTPPFPVETSSDSSEEIQSTETIVVDEEVAEAATEEPTEVSVETATEEPASEESDEDSERKPAE